MNKSIFLWSSFTLIMVLGGINCHNLILDRNMDKLSPQVIVEPLEASVETITARTTCYLATGNLTASGKVPKAGMVAVSDRTIPFGSEIIIDGKTYIVEDRTNKRFQDFETQTIDIFWEDSLESCLEYGVQYKDIIINNK